MAYTPAQAAKILGMSPATIRNYTNDAQLRQFFSASATPPPGQARILSDGDIRVLRFIRSATLAGQTLEAVAARLHTGELGDMPEEEAPQASTTPEDSSPAIVALVAAVTGQLARRDATIDELNAQVRELNAALLDAARETARAITTIEQQRARLEHLEGLVSDKEELARLRAELESKKTFWQRLTGR